MSEILIRGTRRWGHAGVADVRVRDGLIAEVGTGLPAAPDAEVIDASGCLMLPGLVDAHAHLDKTLWGTPWHPHQAGPTLRDKIDNERAVLQQLSGQLAAMIDRPGAAAAEDTQRAVLASAPTAPSGVEWRAGRLLR